MPIVVEKGKVSRTKKDVIEALLMLMENDDFHAITITQIAQEAEIARRTFYLNFDSKEDVIRTYIRILMTEFHENVKANGIRDYETGVRSYFAFWKQHEKFLMLIKKAGLYRLLLNEYENTLMDLDHTDIPKDMQPSNPVSKRYAAVMIAASIWRMLVEWIERGMKDEIDDIASMFAQLHKY